MEKLPVDEKALLRIEMLQLVNNEALLDKWFMDIEERIAYEEKLKDMNLHQLEMMDNDYNMLSEDLKLLHNETYFKRRKHAVDSHNTGWFMSSSKIVEDFVETFKLDGNPNSDRMLEILFQLTRHLS